MTGLTSRQAWTLEHIARCTCGSWMVLTDRQLTATDKPACPHINPDAMRGAA
jgi:hypothetical protein